MFLNFRAKVTILFVYTSRYALWFCECQKKSAILSIEQGARRGGLEAERLAGACRCRYVLLSGVECTRAYAVDDASFALVCRIPLKCIAYGVIVKLVEPEDYCRLTFLCAGEYLSLVLSVLLYHTHVRHRFYRIGHVLRLALLLRHAGCLRLL